ncbi:MAG TPA: 3-phosphoshikimate 1-carboxyvinyltransferase, partial [Actinomycetes bacterium]|nr:3-phosphoshikimate 1-carboxyvinyltransferase [Actinomycetes bacterium]
MTFEASSPSDVALVHPLTAPANVTIQLPGSKSLTNRALLCAALAEGRSQLSGVLFADDTRAMLHAVSGVGAQLEIDESANTVAVTGTDPRVTTPTAHVDADQSGTTSRFILPALGLSPGRSVVDGSAQLRGRPFGPLIDALRSVGVRVDELGEPGYLPVSVTGPTRGGSVELPG